MEKEVKTKEKKNRKMPEGYIGRPKPMKTKTFEFHKPTAGFYVGLGIFVVIAAFITYIVIRLVNVSSFHQPDFEFYEYDEKLTGKTMTLESSSLKFELDPATTQFTLLQKNTGKVWYSSPKDLDKDPIALAREKNNMRSSLLLEYSTENGNAEVYDLYTNSVQRKFYSVEKNGNSIAVHYTIGQMAREYIYPPIMYQSDYDKWTENLSKSDVNNISRAYHRYSLATATSADDTSALLKKYPKLKDEDLYLIFENVQTFMKEKLESIFASAGFTYQDYLESKELYLEDNTKEVPAFNLTVVYSLDKNNLIVEVPFEEISYRQAFPVTKISVLPYFGAGGKDDEGYMLVPEGSGAVINFNNGKTRQNVYYADVYGWDYAQDRKSVVTETRVAFPVFGVSSGDSSFISIIENGASYASITAEIAGKLGSYNYVRADYRMLHNERYDISARTVNAQYMFEKELPQGEKIRQVYTFVDSDSYVDMAKVYRDYLFAGEKKLSDSQTPLAVEIVGAIDRVQQVAGIPKNLPFKLTSYEDAGKIVKEIEDEGISNADYKLTGFINGGVRQKYLNKVKFIRKLGGKSGFKKFLKTVDDTDSSFFLDGTMQFAYHSTWMDGFAHYGTPARFVSQKLCELYEYSKIWYGKNEAVDSYYLIKPSLAQKASKKFTNAAKKYDLNVSYSDFGDIVSADYNEKKLVSREASKNIQIEEFANVKENNLGLMVNGGNDYALSDVDFITNLDLAGNKYSIIDYQVPFYQIALHGYKKYAGSPINLAAETKQEILESAQSGAGLMFTFMNASEQDIQETNFTEYYSANFESWKNEFYSTYKDYNSKLGKVASSLITDFKYESDSVTSTKFENGYSVIVNFGYTDAVTDAGIKIPARDYKVVKVED